jgi:VanZ family protein
VKTPSFRTNVRGKHFPAVAFAAWAVLLLVLSLQSMGVKMTVRFVPSDKLLHAIFYLPLGAFIFWNFYREKKWALIIISTLLAGTYGLLIEIIQGVLPWRAFDYFDALANLSGAGAGALLAATFPRLPFIDLAYLLPKTGAEAKNTENPTS